MPNALVTSVEVKTEQFVIFVLVPNGLMFQNVKNALVTWSKIEKNAMHALVPKCLMVLHVKNARQINTLRTELALIALAMFHQTTKLARRATMAELTNTSTK